MWSIDDDLKKIKLKFTSWTKKKITHVLKNLPNSKRFLRTLRNPPDLALNDCEFCLYPWRHKIFLTGTINQKEWNFLKIPMKNTYFQTIFIRHMNDLLENKNKKQFHTLFQLIDARVVIVFKVYVYDKIWIWIFNSARQYKKNAVIKQS